MPKKLKTIYEYFSDYSEQEIEDLIHSLPVEDKLIIRDRYGNDLHNPQTSGNLTPEKRQRFYGSIIPRMKRLLSQRVDEQENIEVTVPTEEKVIVPDAPSIEVVDYTPMLLEFLKVGKSNREICEKLNINSQQLYEELLKLKNKGIMQTRKYYSDGSIQYSSISTVQALKNYSLEKTRQDRTIITDVEENSMKVLLISDLHFGNELERLDLIDRAFNYCIKNNINIILCGGDLIDGTYTQGTQKISDLYKQIEYFIKNYPHDKSILTFSVAGDHDMSAFNKFSLDLIEMCDNLRHDIIIGGYNNAIINLKNDRLHLYHHTEFGTKIQSGAPIILHGHSHKYLTETSDNALNITIPSLSEIMQPMPSALELDMYFNKGYIASAVVKHLYFGSQDIVLSESRFDLLKGRTIEYGNIRNIEDFRQKVLTREPPHHLSQIEKWQKKYGKV